MKKINSKTLYSIVGVVLVISTIGFINFIGLKVFKRFDLTENKIYTLSDASKRVLAKLDSPVTIKFYYSKNNNRMPVFLKNYAKRVEDLLEEYQQSGNKNLILEKFDPEPDSDDEDAAMMDGVQGQMLNTGDKIYFGLAVSCIDKTATIPFLSPERENLLEYEITRAITEVFKTEKTKIGVMSTLPVMGQTPTPRMMQMGQFKGSSPWLSINELKQSYDVVKIPMSTEAIDPDIKVLILIHPSEISDTTQFAIDQFLLSGGKLIAYLDPKSYYLASQSGNSMNNRGMMQKSSSNIPKLLSAWGIEFDTETVVTDRIYGRKIVRPQTQQHYLSVLDLLKNSFDKDDIITSQLNAVTMVFAGAFKGTPADGLTKTVLVQSSEDSSLMNAVLANNPQYLAKRFKADGKKLDLAICLTGKFKTAFPDGPPSKTQEEKKENNKNSDSSKKTAKSSNDFLKESKNKSAVILIGDSDLLLDDICVRVQSFLGQRLITPLNDNINLCQNITDYMGGDKDMIGIRCRAVVSRPFERVKKIQAIAEQKYQSKINEAEQELRTTQNKLNELQRNKKNRDQRFILSPEQKKELKKFQEQQVKIRKDLKTFRKELRKDIDSLEIKLKWFNIAAIPFLIIIFGIGIALQRKKKGKC